MDSNLKIAARCVIPRLNTSYYYEQTDYKKLIHKLLEYGVSGFCVFGGEAQQVKSMIAELKAIAEQPLIFCADLEFGLPMRFIGGTGFPHAMALGRTGDPTKSGIAAKFIAKEAKLLGIDWNLAPVCDINSNPKNPIINIRSFGEDDKTVSEHSVYYMKATQNEKVLACGKHFPGHGDTDIDSHLDLPVLEKTGNDFQTELKPFINNIKNGIKSIMIGHLWVKAIDKEKVPATLSYNVITQLLKEQLGFSGLVISDALEMKSISNSYSSGEATIKFFEAGGDIALMPENPFDAIEELSAQIAKKTELKEHLLSSYRKLRKEMDFVGAFNPPNMDDSFQEHFLEHERIALELARDCVELKVKNNVIPISSGTQYAGFAFLQKEDDFGSASMFFNFMQQALENDCDFAYINEEIADEDLEQLRLGIEEADLVLFAVFHRSRSYLGDIGTSEKISAIMKKIAMGKPIVTVYFGNPYLSNEIISDTSILTYSNSLASLAAATMVLSGRSSNMENTPNS
jgi:beta-glucosidase-like glycosyl hydrolase